jgi:hypothetical protein
MKYVMLIISLIIIGLPRVSLARGAARARGSRIVEAGARSDGVPSVCRAHARRGRAETAEPEGGGAAVRRVFRVRRVRYIRSTSFAQRTFYRMHPPEKSQNHARTQAELATRTLSSEVSL